MQQDCSDRITNIEICHAEKTPLRIGRGIDRAAARQGWRAGKYSGFKGWFIPFHDPHGKPLINPTNKQRITAFKTAPGQPDAPHDKWIKGTKPEGLKPCLLPATGIIQAIAQHGGLVCGAEGHADFLTLLETGHENVLGFPGTSFVPDNLAEQALSWGVQAFTYYCHSDAVQKVAQKLVNQFNGSGIAVTIKLLPMDASGKKAADLNDFWRMSGYDRAAFEAQLAELPTLDLKPEPVKVYAPAAPARPVTASKDRIAAYGLAALDRIIGDLRSTGEGNRNNRLFVAARQLGALIAVGALEQGLVERELQDAGLSLGLKERTEVLPTIASGLKRGLKEPRDLSHLIDRPLGRVPFVNSPCHKLSQQNDKPYIWRRAADGAILSAFSALKPAQPAEPETPMIGQLIRLFCSDEPKQALDLVECAEVDRRTAERRRMGNPITCIQVKGDKIAQTVYLRQNWLRTLFPPDDPITALIPFDNLLPEHFDNRLTEEEIAALGEHPKLAPLKGQQKRAVKARLAIMGRVECLLDQLDKVPFYQDRPVVNLSDLRSQVLRAVIEHQTKVDKDTLEVKRPKLSNAVQACLLGVTTGALRNIRDNGGIKQHIPAVVEHPLTHAQDIPRNCRRIAVKGYYDAYRDWRKPTSPDAPAFIERNLREGRAVVAVIQPPAEQELGPLPERQPRQRPLCKAMESKGSTSVETPAEIVRPGAQKPRRTPRQTYAAKLMVAILYHLDPTVKADKSEPLDVLAGKLRSAVTDRGRMLYHQCIALPDEDRIPFINALPDEDQALFWDARNQAGRKVAA